MIKNSKFYVAVVGALIFGGASLFAGTSVAHATASSETSTVIAATGNPLFDKSCESSGGSALCQPDQRLFGPESIWTRIVNTLIFIIGVISVLMIVIGGLRYTLSGGDSGSLTNAKNTILYALVGLVVAVSAYAMVNFVLSALV